MLSLNANSYGIAPRWLRYLDVSAARVSVAIRDARPLRVEACGAAPRAVRFDGHATASVARVGVAAFGGAAWRESVTPRPSSATDAACV